ncbi:TetR/AcrR family transcriptional regulator [Candidatus Sumerlaeota bacterium]|nr:TetR/AcrR family transcriptional regulator [Candidatus Sumerlaeota bacterium]
MTTHWKRRPQARPEEILAAASEVFILRGYAQATMQEIAQAAGVSAGTIYRYYEGKEALFHALVRHRATDVLSTLREATQASISERCDWRALVRSLLQFAYEHISRPEIMGLLQLVLGEGTRMPELTRLWYQEVISQGQERIIAMISAGMDRGELRRLDPVIAARSLLGMVLILALERRVFGEGDRAHLKSPSLFDELTEIWLDGLLEESDA